MARSGTVVSLESKDDEGSEPRGKTPAEWQKYWTTEFASADKRFKSYLSQGNKVTKRYTDERKSADDSSVSDGMPSRLNLFHTNIQILQSMLYGSTPKIEVSREHQDPDDDIARVASLLYQRILEADIQSSGDDLATALRAALQDRLLPGFGTCRVMYTFETEKKPVLNPATMQMEDSEELVDEQASVSYVHWQDCRWGWGRTWTEVPWFAFRSWLSKEDAEKRFGKEKARNLSYVNQTPSGDDKTTTDEKDEASESLKAAVWEIWNKKDKRVYWWSKECSMVLDIKNDPLRLDGFLPTPMPMAANLTTSLYLPRADFVVDQDQYNEIDILYTRILMLVKAVRVVGVYDKAAQDSVGRMLNEGVENTMIPVDNWAMFSESGGLKGKVDWFPIEQVVGVLQTLRQVLGESIDLLYQVTGMSDIMRGGNTDQYTSDGTNKLKAKFGSIRIQALQDEFARFASDLDALKAEVISKHYSPETIAVQSSAGFLPSADLDKVEPAIKLMQSPEVKWRIQIRPESIAMVDYAQLKSERTEFLTAISTFLQSMQAVVQAVPGSLPVMLEMLKWGMAGFKGGNYLEGIMDRAIDMAVKAPPENKDAGKEQERAAAHAADMEKIQAKLAADMQVIQVKAQSETEKLNLQHQNKMEQEMAKHRSDIEAIMTDMRSDLSVIAAKLRADMQMETAQAQGSAAASQVDFENDMEIKAFEHQLTMRETEEAHENALEAGQENRKADTD